MEGDRGALGKAIIKAANGGDAARVEELLRQDPSLVGAVDASGSTPLHRAAWKGHLAVAELLLGHGADPNQQDRNEHYGGTPLHAAAHANQKAVVALLIERGADVNVRGPNGRTPLEESAYHKATARRSSSARPARPPSSVAAGGLPARFSPILRVVRPSRGPRSGHHALAPGDPRAGDTHFAPGVPDDLYRPSPDLP